MTTTNQTHSDFIAEDQILELTEDQLEAVEGGGMWWATPIIIDLINRLT